MPVVIHPRNPRQLTRNHPKAPIRTTPAKEREGVNEMAKKARESARPARAWDELPEADRQALLAAARIRRQQQAQRDAIEAAVWAGRLHR